MSNSKRSDLNSLEVVAGNGLINRRALLGRGIAFAGATDRGRRRAFTSAAAEPLPVDPWSITTGSKIPAYGAPAKYENKVVRTLTNPNHEPRTSQARTPHHLLNGTITPNGLHFVVAAHRLPRHRSGQAPPGHPWPGQAAAGVQRSRRWRAIRWSRASISSNAAATARRSTTRIRSRPTCRRSTASSPARNGPACGSRPCSKRPASTRRRNGSWRKAPTGRA